MPQAPKNCECGWVNDQGMVICLSHFGPDKGLRDRMSDVKSVRDHYRAGFAKEGSGLIECDVCEFEGVRGVRAIGKLLLQPNGAAYAGTIAMPLPKESYVFNLVAKERGITGLREAAVMLKMTAELEKQGFTLNVPPPDQSQTKVARFSWRNASTGALIYWEQDPYDPDWRGPCLRNLADAPEHDSGFPEHPVSRIRAALQCLAQGMRLSPELKKRAVEKKRWKFW